jgi:hypothetical protein
MGTFRLELLTYVLAPVYRRIFTEDGHGEMCDTVTDLWAKGERVKALEAIDDGFVMRRSAIGTSDEVKRRYQEYRDLGADAICIFPLPEEDEANVEAGRLRIVTALAPQAVAATRA